MEFIAEGRATKAVAEALASAEKRVESLKDEIEHLESSRNSVFRAPTRDWLRQHVGTVQEVLERRTHRSALIREKGICWEQFAWSRLGANMDDPITQPCLRLKVLPSSKES